VTDHVLHNEALIGRSLALTVGCAMPAMALVLLAARACYAAQSACG
jgi:hypothetical protein